MKLHFFCISSVFLLVLSLTLAVPQTRTVYASGVEITVTTLEDTSNTDGKCSLREAIEAANTNNPVDACSPGSSSTFDIITFRESGVIELTSTLPIIKGQLRIDGSNQSVTIDGKDSARIMEVDQDANLEIINLIFVNGYAPGPNSGGAIRNLGKLTVTNSTFSNNKARSGGAIGNAGNLSITNSAFIENRAFVYGGSIVNGGELTIENSTFARNRADYGGGIANVQRGKMNVNSSTLSENGAVLAGGGIFIADGSDSVIVNNTIIARSRSGGDCKGTFNPGSKHNLIEDGTNTCGLANNDNGNIVGQDPKLGVLTDTVPYYFPLNADSPALNAADTTTCLSKDQRGVTRPQGGRCDIGAVEIEMILTWLPLVSRS